MAKVTFGALVNDVRNKIGGTVFGKTHTGPMVRKRIKPRNPRTNTQLTQRSTMTSLARRWGATLTAVQRAGWIALATTITIKDKLGNPHHPTGENLYIRCNLNLQTIGVAFIDDAPADQSVTALTTITPTMDSVAPTGSLAYTATPAAAGHYVVLYASAQVSAGRNTSFGQIAFISHGAAAGASPLNFLAAYTAKWGTLIGAKKVRLKVLTINSTNGAASIPLESTATIT